MTLNELMFLDHRTYIDFFDCEIPMDKWVAPLNTTDGRELTGHLIGQNYGSKNVFARYENNTSVMMEDIFFALQARKYEIETLLATTQFDYDPIVNYDNHETITESTTSNGSVSGTTTNTATQTGTDTVANTGTNTSKQSGTDKVNGTATTTDSSNNKNVKTGSTTENGGTGNSGTDTTTVTDNTNSTTIDSVAGYNNTAKLSDEKASQTTNGGTNTTTVAHGLGTTSNNTTTFNDLTDTATASGISTTKNDTTNTKDLTNTDTLNTTAKNTKDLTDTATGSNENTTENKTSFSHELLRSGNIGTMTTQQMIREERGIAAFSIHLLLAQIVSDTICTCIYD